MFRLKALRKEKNMTQSEVAKRFKVSPSAIGMYEQGRRVPPADMLNEMSVFFDVSIEYLLGKTSYRLRPSSLTAKTTHSYTLKDGEAAEELLNTALKTEQGKEAIKTLIEDHVINNAYAQFDKGLAKAFGELMKHPDEKITMLKIDIIKAILKLDIEEKKLAALKTFVTLIK